MILITDDDIAIRTSLSLLLKQEGFVVWTAANPAEAYTIVKEKPVRLVLLDMNFSLETSGEEGMEALRKIKSLKDLGSVTYLKIAVQANYLPQTAPSQCLRLL